MLIYIKHTLFLQGSILVLLFILITFVGIPNIGNSDSEITTVENNRFDILDKEWKSSQINNTSHNSLSLNAIPIISQPDDISYREGETGNVINWQVDGGGGQKMYTIYRNGTSIISGSWSPNSVISENVDGLKQDTYNYTIVVSSSDGSSYDQVWVYVTPNFAFTSSPSDFTYSLNTTGNFLNWTISGSIPGYYELYRNGSFVFSSGWFENIPIIVNVDGLSLGLYNFTIHVWNGINEKLIDIVYVSVTSGPILEQVPNQTIFPELLTNYTLKWIALDLNPSYYEVYEDGILEMNDTWFSGSIVEYNISSTDYSNHTVEINFYNINAESITNQLNIQFNQPPILDITPESIIEVLEGENYQLIWSANDTEPNRFDIYRNTSLVDTGEWYNESQVIFNTNRLSTGTHNITIQFNDKKHMITSSSVIVLVDDQTNPILIKEPISGQYSYSQNKIPLYWELEEEHPGVASFSINSSDPISYDWKYYNFSLDLNFEKLGNHIIDYTFTDTSGNSVSGSVTITIIDDVAPKLISFADNQTSQYGQSIPNLFWQFEDIYGGSYSIYHNSKLVEVALWSNNTIITYSVNDLNVGTHNITIHVIDKSGNDQNSTIFVNIIPRSTVSPNLNIPTEVVEGSSLTLKGTWFTLNSTIPVSGGIITTQLEFHERLLYQSKFDISQDGKYSIFLDHDNLSEDNYTWVIKFEQSNYQNWTLSLDVNVKWVTINLNVIPETTLIQGKDYGILVSLQENSGLRLLDLSIAYIQNITVNLEVNYQTMTKSNRLYFDTILISEDDSRIVVPAEFTSNMKKLHNITISITDGQNISMDPITLHSDNLPSISGENMVNSLILLLNITPLMFIFILSAISVYPLYILVANLQSLLSIMLNYSKNSKLDEWCEILALLIFNRSGVLYHDEKYNQAELMDSNLIAGLTSAISHFLEEMNPDASNGFKEIKNEGMSIVLHTSEKSILAVVSDQSISDETRNIISIIHKNVEIELDAQLEQNVSHLDAVQTRVIHQIADRYGLPLSIIKTLSINLQRLQHLMDRERFSYLYHNAFDLTIQYKETINSNQKSLKHFRDYLIKNGVRSQIVGPYIIELINSLVIS